MLVSICFPFCKVLGLFVLARIKNAMASGHTWRISSWVLSLHPHHTRVRLHPYLRGLRFFKERDVLGTVDDCSLGCDGNVPLCVHACDVSSRSRIACVSMGASSCHGATLPARARGCFEEYGSPYTVVRMLVPRRGCRQSCSEDSSTRTGRSVGHGHRSTGTWGGFVALRRPIACCQAVRTVRRWRWRWRRETRIRWWWACWRCRDPLQNTPLP